MANSYGLLEKEKEVFASNQPAVLTPHADMLQNQPDIASEKQLTIDQALEDKLAGTPIDDILSKREKQILEYIIAGNTNKEIAQKLYRTQRTVEYHRNRLMRKLNTHTTAELVKRAILMGIA